MNVTLDQEVSGDTADPIDILALDRAMDQLDQVDPTLRQVVELKYFGGLSDTEIGVLLGVTRRTTQRYWTRARAWLHRELSVQES